jgi:hypothetical protein
MRAAISPRFATKRTRTGPDVAQAVVTRAW